MGSPLKTKIWPESIQRRAARLLYKDYRGTSSVTFMMKDLGWKVLKLMTDIENKDVNDLVAWTADSFINYNSIDQLYHHTINKLKERSTNTAIFKNSLVPRTIKDWSSISEDGVNYCEL